MPDIFLILILSPTNKIWGGCRQLSAEEIASVVSCLLKEEQLLPVTVLPSLNLSFHYHQSCLVVFLDLFLFYNSLFSVSCFLCLLFTVLLLFLLGHVFYARFGNMTRVNLMVYFPARIFSSDTWRFNTKLSEEWTKNTRAAFLLSDWLKSQASSQVNLSIV